MSTPLPPTLGRYVVAADVAVRDVARVHDGASLARAREAVAVIRGVGALIANEQLSTVADVLLDALRVVAERPDSARAGLDVQLSVLVTALVDAAGGDADGEHDPIAQARGALDALRANDAPPAFDAGTLQSTLATFNRDARAACAIPEELARIDALLTDAHALRAAAAELLIAPVEQIASALAALLAAHLAGARPLDEPACELLRVCGRILPAMAQHRSDLTPFRAPSEAIIRRAAELRQALLTVEPAVLTRAQPAAGYPLEPAATVEHDVVARVLTVAGEHYLLLDSAIASVSDTAVALADNWHAAVQVARLSELLDVPGAVGRSLGTLVKLREFAWFLLADDVTEPQSFTILPLPRLLRDIPGVRGAARLPSGGLALLLDSATLVRHAVAIELATPAGSDDDACAPRGDRLVALIVDDAVSVRRRLGRALQALGWECVQARDGLEALAALDERRVDLLITDLDMPRMAGEELIVAARQRAGSQPPIVALAPRPELARLQAAGIVVDDTLVKPFRDDDVDALLTRLRFAPVSPAERARS